MSDLLGISVPSDHPFLARMLSTDASTLLNAFDPSSLSPHNPLTQKKLQSRLTRVLINTVYKGPIKEDFGSTYPK